MLLVIWLAFGGIRVKKYQQFIYVIPVDKVSLFRFAFRPRAKIDILEQHIKDQKFKFEEKSKKLKENLEKFQHEEEKEGEKWNCNFDESKLSDKLGSPYQMDVLFSADLLSAIELVDQS